MQVTICSTYIVSFILTEFYVKNHLGELPLGQLQLAPKHIQEP